MNEHECLEAALRVMVKNAIALINGSSLWDFPDQTEFREPKVEQLAFHCSIVADGGAGDMAFHQLPLLDALTMYYTAQVLGHWVDRYGFSYIPECDGGNRKGAKKPND